MESGLQLSAQRKDGTTFPVEISLSAMSDEPGSPLVLAAIRDVTERTEFAAERQRQALEAQSEQSHRLESLGQLAGGVAHDFNNLLGVILNYTALLSRRLSDPTATADLGEIRAAAERAAGLTRQLLTFARRDVANPEPIEVNNVVQEIASMLERTLGEQIELRLDLAVGPLIAMVDKQQLDQVVMNLAINSRDAMAGGGTLTIATARSPAGSGRVGDVVLRVIDTGAGMAPEVRARAFEPFFTTKPHGQGTGLGLATVYGVVRQNDGDITIDSGVGVGTTVSVVLRAARGATPACGYPTEAAEGGTERILLVEDEVGLRVGTARILAEQGYEVLVASDGIEALEVFDGEDGMIDIVLSDVVMPRMRGDDLARILADRAPGIPVILLSGYDSDARVTGPLLPKPVGEAVLLRAIREALDV
jgi:signal transduction histidine kinase